MDRAHQFALGGERDFAHAFEARIEGFLLQARLEGCHDQRAFGRVALHRPLAVVVLEDGVVGAIGGSQGARDLRLQDRFRFADEFWPYLSHRRIPGSA